LPQSTATASKSAALTTESVRYFPALFSSGPSNSKTKHYTNPTSSYHLPHIPTLRIIPSPTRRHAGYASGIYPTAAFFNHSCAPNCDFYFDAAASGGGEPPRICVRALTDVQCGEDCFIS
jgi:SET domain-containing protein